MDGGRCGSQKPASTSSGARVFPPASLRTVPDGVGKRAQAGRPNRLQAACLPIEAAIFFRALKIRFMTVPMGTSKVSAISRYLRSW